MNAIPKTYVLTLHETQDRTNKAWSHLTGAGLPFQFFFGLNADQLGLQTRFPYEVDAPGSGFNIGSKYVGVWLSHYMLWSSLSLLPDDHHHIMEVDAKLKPNWAERFGRAIKDVPDDFDILFTGSCCCKGHPMTRVAGDVYRMENGTGPQCLHSYIVAKKALPVLMKTQNKLYAPIDISMIFHSFPQLKVYVVLPRIVDQFDTEIPE